MKITQREFAKMLAQKHNCTIKEALYFIDDFIDEILERTDDGLEVGFQNFGSFKRVVKKQKEIIHPLTKKRIIRKEYSTLKFKPSKLNRIESDDVKTIEVETEEKVK